MAFSVKITSEDICPVCRRRYKKGRKISSAAYCEGCGEMCESCYQHGYLNIKAGRTAAIIDDPANLPVKLAPARILEKPLFSKKKNDSRGYEFRMPHVTGFQIAAEALTWLVFCLAASLISEFFGSDMCTAVLDLIISAGSCLFGIKDLCLLIKGIFCGMGHPRRLMLLAAVSVFALLACVFVPRLISGVSDAFAYLRS